MPLNILAAPAAVPAAPRQNLDSVRSEIDRIDDQILELMARRMAHARAIAALKNDSDDALLLRPNREQEVIDRLADRAADRAADMPREAVSAIWRELMAVSLQTQRRTEIVLHAAQQPIPVTNAARQRFGCAAPIIVAGAPQEALDRARSRSAIAVVELHPLSNWWTELYHDSSLVILDALEGNHGGITALAIGRLDEACLAPGRRYLILSAANLAKRIAAGEAIRPIALSGELRLCILETEEALTAMPRMCVGA